MVIPPCFMSGPENDFLQSDATHRYSRQLYWIVSEQILNKVGAVGVPKSGFLVSTQLKQFESEVRRGSSSEVLMRRLSSAHLFATNVSDGIGGDALQRFVAAHAPWSMVKTCTPTSTNLAPMSVLWTKELGLDFAGILLPVWSDKAVLLFEIKDDDLANLTGPRTYFVAALVLVENAKDVLMPIREALGPKTDQCVHLPRKYLLPPKNSERALRTFVDVNDLSGLQLEQVQPFGANARFRYLTFCMLDARVIVVPK